MMHRLTDSENVRVVLCTLFRFAQFLCYTLKDVACDQSRRLHKLSVSANFTSVFPTGSTAATRHTCVIY